MLLGRVCRCNFFGLFLWLLCRSLGNFFHRAFKVELLLITDFFDVHDNVILAFENALEQFFRKRVFDALSDRTAERPGSVIRVVALIDDELLGIVFQLEAKTALGQPLADFGKFDVDQAKDISQAVGISCMPTFIVFKNGNEVDRMEGASEQGIRDICNKNK